MTLDIKIINTIVKGIFTISRELINKYAQNPKNIEAKLDIHMTELVNWSGNIQLYGMSKARNTDCDTIKLDISDEPRKFRGINSLKLLDEVSLLDDLDPYFLLGDPGSGKTTTIKRIVRNLLLKDQLSKNDIFQFPIVVRLRELKETETLHVSIAKKIGLQYSIKKNNSSKSQSISQSIEDQIIVVGNDTIEDVLPKFLNELKAVLMIDGVDELNIDRRSQVENEILSLSYRLDTCKLIVSCRSGGHITAFTGFNIVEICPLSVNQNKQIVQIWADDPSNFLENLENKPYCDLANRPLFLISLILIFNRFGVLPEQPSSIYKRIINLMLEEWDERRKVRRLTKYSGFDVDRKLEFLSGLSFELTININKNIFTTEDLILAYNAIYQSFNLPKNEAQAVANEIENHTGIIVESKLDMYEFSHLSLQEYLCAYYLVREAVSENVLKYFHTQPSPIAISVSLSSDPSTWLGTLLLQKNSFDSSNHRNLTYFFKRLILERPFFTPRIILGLAIFKIYFKFDRLRHNHVYKVLDEFVELKGVKESLAMSLPLYQAPAYHEGNNNELDFVYLKRVSCQPCLNAMETPGGGSIPNKLLLILLQNYSGKLSP